MVIPIKPPITPQIKASNETHLDINALEGKSCLVKVFVKYEQNRDWTKLDLWLEPGWQIADIYKNAYRLIRKNSESLLSTERIIEEAKLDSITEV